MSHRFIILLFVISIVSHDLLAQEGLSTNRISKIEFSGLKRTQTSYLGHYIQSKVGETISDSLLQVDVQKLKNVASIGNAKYRLEKIGDTQKIIFEVEEVRTLLPIVNFGGIRGNLWFQVGFSDINWGGKGQFLSAAYQNNDRRHSGNIFYRVPSIAGTNWGFSASLNRWASREPLFFPEGTVNYDYNNTGLGLTAIRRFGFHRNLEFGGTYFVEEYGKSENQFFEDPPGPDDLTQPKWLAKVEYSENFLDYHYFYLEGSAWRVTLQDVFNTLDQTWFHSLQFQGKHFSRVGKKGNFAMRLRAAIATNNDTPFAPFVVDSHVNLRGVGNRIDRGTAQVIFNAEYRHTLRENKKWAAQAIGFSDIGTWRNPGGQFSDLFNSNNFRHFVGGGFRIIYQKVYNAVLRIDYGVDIFNPEQRGLVIGLGQYF